MTRLTRGVIAALLLAGVAAAALPALAVPNQYTLGKVMMIEATTGSHRRQGTMFTVVVDNREYWITAKHLLTGVASPPWGSIKDASVSLRVLDSTFGWGTMEFSVLDPGDLDVVVLFSTVPFSKHLDAGARLGSAGLNLGSPCEFVGFPYGLAWRAKVSTTDSIQLPFVRSCSVAAFSSEAAPFWILDGFDNPGFAGSPVIFGEGSEQSILGVVSGGLPDEIQQTLQQPDPAGSSADAPADTASRTPAPATPGFVLAYDIQLVVDAIRDHPRGPQLSAQ